MVQIIYTQLAHVHFYDVTAENHNFIQVNHLYRRAYIYIYIYINMFNGHVSLEAVCPPGPGGM